MGSIKIPLLVCRDVLIVTTIYLHYHDDNDTDDYYHTVTAMYHSYNHTTI